MKLEDITTMAEFEEYLNSQPVNIIMVTGHEYQDIDLIWFIRLSVRTRDGRTTYVDEARLHLTSASDAARASKAKEALTRLLYTIDSRVMR